MELALGLVSIISLLGTSDFESVIHNTHYTPVETDSWGCLTGCCLKKS